MYEKNAVLLKNVQVPHANLGVKCPLFQAKLSVATRVNSEWGACRVHSGKITCFSGWTVGIAGKMCVRPFYMQFLGKITSAWSSVALEWVTVQI